MTDEQKVADLRRKLPATARYAYLNTGTTGPLPEPAHRALSAAWAEELDAGRIGPGRHDATVAAMDAARSALATVVRADPRSVTITQRTNDGLNIAVWGLPWQPGDEVVTTNLEHPAGLLPVYAAARRFGLVVRFADVTGPDPTAALVAQMNARTRLLLLSHASYLTGVLLPLADIVAAAHARGVLVAADGAQTAGAVPLDVGASGVDFYALPGQKWLLGPEGTGGLFVRPDLYSVVAPTFVGYRSAASFDQAGNWVPHATGARYEVGSFFAPTLVALAQSVEFVAAAGWDWVFHRIRQLAADTREQLLSIPGVTVLTPPERHAGLVAFRVAGQDSAAVVTALARAGYVVRTVPLLPPAVRVSCGFYNTEAELAGLVAEVRKLAAQA